MNQTLKPIEPPFPTDIAQILKTYPAGDDGYILKLFRLFANSRRFLSGKGVLNLLDKDSPLSLREREIVILRVTANLDCEYEWGVHVSVFSKAAGLDKQQVRYTRTSNTDTDTDIGIWTAKEMLLLRVIDELCEQGSVQIDTYGKFQHHWSYAEQLEIFALCGNYHTISYVANSTGLPLEETGARFPE